jgi:hypothetical protein
VSEVTAWANTGVDTTTAAATSRLLMRARFTMLFLRL